MPAPASGVGDQEPPAVGVPVKAANNWSAVTVLPAHILSVPSVPAFGSVQHEPTVTDLEIVLTAAGLSSVTLKPTVLTPELANVKDGFTPVPSSY
ncbi:MAG: hypothetical protein ABIO55_03770 [Ginsengibacter sp.]